MEDEFLVFTCSDLKGVVHLIPGTNSPEGKIINNETICGVSAIYVSIGNDPLPVQNALRLSIPICLKCQQLIESKNGV